MSSFADSLLGLVLTMFGLGITVWLCFTRWPRPRWMVVVMAVVTAGVAYWTYAEATAPPPPPPSFEDFKNDKG